MKKSNRWALLVGGSKGGTGKSMVAAGLCNTFVGRGTSVELLETDTSNPDVLSMVGDIPMNPIDQWGNYTGWQIFGQLASDSQADAIVVNTKAGDVTAFDCLLQGRNRRDLTEEEWVNAKRELADLMDACGRKIVYLHVMRREPVNVYLAGEVLPWLSDNVIKVAVRNGYYGKPDEFVHWNNSDTRKVWLARGGIELNWPGATDYTMHEVYHLSKSKQLTPETLKTVSDFDLISGRVLLDTTKCLPIANRAAMEKHGANRPLITALHHYQARIAAAVEELEYKINAKKGN